MSFWKKVTTLNRAFLVPEKKNLFGLLPPGADYTQGVKGVVLPFYKDDPVGLYGAIKGDTGGGSSYASDTYSGLIRDQYNDWLKRYYPYIQKQMDLSDNSLMNSQLGRVGELAQQAQQGSQTGAANQLARYGIAQHTPDNDNSRGINSSLAIAGAKNGIREAERDRQLNILTGSSSPLRGQMNIINPGK